MSPGDGSPTPRPRLALEQALRERGVISDEQLRIAAGEQRRRAAPLGRVLVQLGFVSDAQLREAQARASGQQLVDLGARPIDPAVAALVPAAVARRFRVLPIALDPATSVLQLATTDPGDVVALDQVRSALPHGMRVEPVLAREADIITAIERHHGAERPIDHLSATLLASEGEGGRNADPPVVALVDALLHDAAQQRASDIHFEPGQGSLRIRHRVDGVLRHARSLDRACWPAMLVRLKVLGGMNIAETRAPQDGRLSMALGGRQLDFRLATQPTTHGEAMVLRLLDRERGIVALHGLGLACGTRRLLERMLARPEGMLLVTGPTGSGKTTTLYSLLSHVSGEGVNVMTLEDPVEYPMATIRQTSVNEAARLDFASGIRSMLRQDPDIILVGEIRDAATAEMALRAAMTGHQVFSTLHASSAIGALPRLRDLGAPAALLAGNLIGVIAQRLVRRLCPHCRSPRVPDATTRAWLGIGRDAECVVHEPTGCPRCEGIGYRGRVAIVEALRIDAEIDDCIARQASARDIRAAAKAGGFQPMIDDAIRRVLAGDTSTSEIARVLDLTDRLP